MHQARLSRIRTASAVAVAALAIAGAGSAAATPAGPSAEAAKKKCKGKHKKSSRGAVTAKGCKKKPSDERPGYQPPAIPTPSV